VIGAYTFRYSPKSAKKYEILSTSDYISLKYGDMMIFNMAVVRHFEFSEFDIWVKFCITKI